MVNPVIINVANLKFNFIMRTTDTLAYGEELTAPYEDSNDKVLNTITYTGHEKDYETNLTYMLARYYSQGYGRFLSPDPGYDYDQLDPMSWNLYAYVRGNPVKNVDKTGKFVGTIVGGLVGGLIEGYYNKDKKGGFWRGFMKGAISGAIAGAYVDVAVATGGTSVIVTGGATVLGSAFGNVVGEEVDSVVYKKKIASSEEVIESANVGLISGAISYLGGKFTSKIFSRILTKAKVKISTKYAEKALEFIESTTKLEISGKIPADGFLDKGAQTILNDGKFELNVTKTTIMTGERGINLGLETGKYIFLKPLEEALKTDVTKEEVH